MSPVSSSVLRAVGNVSDANLHQDLSLEDRRDALDLELCDAMITEQTSIAKNEPPAVQELARLQIERISLQLHQLDSHAAVDVSTKVSVMSRLGGVTLTRLANSG